MSDSNSSCSIPGSTQDYSQFSALALQAQSELDHLRHLLTDTDTISPEADASLRERFLSLQCICNRALGLVPEQNEKNEELQAQVEDTDCSISLQGTVNPDHIEINTDGSFSMGITDSNMRMLLRTESIFRVKVQQLQVSGEIINI
ncbi:MAG: hypothetical protein AB1589_01285 [Cyanobacteriota bacterium]